MSQELSRRALLQLSLGAAAVGGLGGAGLAGAAPASAAVPASGPLHGHAFRLAMQFWFEFDNATQYRRPKEMDDAWAAIAEHWSHAPPPPRSIWEIFRDMHRDPSYPQNFIEDWRPIREPLAVMSGIQAKVFDRFYPHGGPLLTEAFSYFGQGVLYHADRPAGEPRVHTMGRKPPSGYHVWHIFMRAMIYLDIEPARWSRIAPLNAFAWALQTVAKPDEQSHNPPLPRETVRKLKRFWLGRTLDELDTAFESFPYPPGMS